MEERYQRSQIQNAAHKYEQQIYDGTRPIIGLNKYRDGDDDAPEVKLARTPRAKQQLQVDRLRKFKKKNAQKAKRALDELAAVAERGKSLSAETGRVEAEHLSVVQRRLRRAGACRGR